MKKLIIIIYMLIFAHTSFGQKIDSYYLSFRGASLPGGKYKSEIYFKKKGKSKHTSIKKHHTGKRNKWKTKKRNLKKDKQIKNTINLLDSLFRLTEFKFTINKSIIDSLKVRNYRDQNHQIPSTYINKFFSHGDTVTLNFKDFIQDTLHGIIIDGYPYEFNLILVRHNQDSIKYNFHGNILDGVGHNNLKNWLVVYLAYRQSKFFETMPMEYYFTDKNLISVLRRCIEMKK